MLPETAERSQGCGRSSEMLPGHGREPHAGGAQHELKTQAVRQMHELLKQPGFANLL